MNTKKSIYLVIISVIAVGAILFGSFRFAKSLSFGTIRNWFHDDLKDFSDWHNSYVDEDFDDADVTRTSKKIVDSNGEFTKTFNEITKIKVLSEIMVVEIEEGPEFSIKCSYNHEYLKPIVNYDDGTLTVSQRNLKKKSIGSNKAQIIIYIPRYNKIDDINVKVNVGEIEIEKIVGEKLSVISNVGQIKMDEISFDEIYVKTNVGEIDIELSEPVTEYSLDLEANIGEIIADGRTAKKRYSCRGATRKKIEAKTNVGEIRIQ